VSLPSIDPRRRVVPAHQRTEAEGRAMHQRFEARMTLASEWATELSYSRPVASVVHMSLQ
jgi:hypothetical protein